jgi:hypothetical protein
MTYIGNITRSAGDPKIVLTGPSSMTTEVRLARALGWFSIGLGAIEFLGAAAHHPYSRNPRQ